MAVSGIHEELPGAKLQVNGSPREIFYMKGAIEAILDRCKFYFVNEGSTPALDANTRNVIITKANAAASRGLRVIAMAYGYGSAGAPTTVNASPSPSRAPSPQPSETPSNLVFVGFQAMLDPPRKGVADSIGALQAGGVQVVMITGDAEPTALSIAQKLGLQTGRPGRDGNGTTVSSQHCLTGKAIDTMTKAQLKERVGTVSVFARTTPKHKMAIIEAFQARGKVVAMTGDGGRLLGFCERTLLIRVISKRCACA